eukprot:5646194-Pleurochrysis_carterae.AAC.1
MRCSKRAEPLGCTNAAKSSKQNSQALGLATVAICNDISNSLTLLGVYSVALSREGTQSCAHA